MVTSPAAIEDPSVPAGTEDPPEVSVEPPPSPVSVPLPAESAVPAAPVPVDEEERQEEERLAKLRQRDERNLRHATLHEEEHYKDFDFSEVVDRKAAMRTTTVESYISLHLGGRPLPRNRVERELLRVEVALQRFHGWGAESEEAFYREMEGEAKHREGRDILGYDLIGRGSRAVIASRTGAGSATSYDWPQFLEAAHRHPAYTPADEMRLYPMWEAAFGDPGNLRTLRQLSAPAGQATGISPESAAKLRELAERMPRLLKARRLYGSEARGQGEGALIHLEDRAKEAGIFIPLTTTAKAKDFIGWSDKEPEERQSIYREIRDEVASNFGLTPEEVDDVVKHRLETQEKAVSRDALGQVHIKNEIFFKGLPEIQKAIAASDLSTREKDEQLKNLPERFGRFKEAVIANTMKNMPEFAKEFGIRSVEDYDKLTAVLHEGIGMQAAGGASVGLGKTASGILYYGGLFEKKLKGETFRNNVTSYLEERSEEVDRRGKVNEAINALSHEFNKEKTTLLGVDAALIGQGLYSVGESAALAFLTGPLAPEIAVAKYGNLARAFNAASKVMPVAGIFGARQGFTTYDEALRMGLKEDEAIRLGWYAGLIEGATTVAFSAVGAGGVEGIASGAARETLRGSLRTSVRSAWKEGANSFGKGMLGELAEEEVITILDAAVVQTRLRPDMTAEDFQKAVYETAIVTLLSSGAFSAAHGKQAYDITTANNVNLERELVGTSPVDPASADPAPTTPDGTIPVPDLGDIPRAVHTPGGGFTLLDPGTGAEIGRAPTAEAAARMAAEHAGLTLEKDAARIAVITTAYQAAENSGESAKISGFDPAGTLNWSFPGPTTAESRKILILSERDFPAIDLQLKQGSSPASTWVPHPDFQKPAIKHGQFLADVGNSPFGLSDSKADEIGIPRGTTIPWIKGIPDFSAHAVAGPNGSPGVYEVPGLTGNHNKDRETIIGHLATENAISQRKIKAWLKKNRICLHHSGSYNVQNVRRKLHELHHSGGAQALRDEH